MTWNSHILILFVLVAGNVILNAFGIFHGRESALSSFMLGAFFAQPALLAAWAVFAGSDYLAIAPRAVTTLLLLGVASCYGTGTHGLQGAELHIALLMGLPTVQCLVALSALSYMRWRLRWRRVNVNPRQSAPMGPSRTVGGLLSLIAVNALILAAATRIIAAGDFALPTSDEPIRLIAEIVEIAGITGVASGLSTSCVMGIVLLFGDPRIRRRTILVLMVVLLPAEVAVMALGWDLASLDSFSHQLFPMSAMIAGCHVAIFLQLAAFWVTGDRLNQVLPEQSA